MTDHYAMNDEHALSITRRIIRNLNYVKQPQVSLAEPEEPLYASDELYGIVSENLRKTFDIRQVWKAGPCVCVCGLGLVCKLWCLCRAFMRFRQRSSMSKWVTTFLSAVFSACLGLRPPAGDNEQVLTCPNLGFLTVSLSSLRVYGGDPQDL